MSRAFVNEDEQQVVPFVPPRADLPPGATNYITPMGLEMLLQEKSELLEELNRLNKSDEIGKLVAIKVVNIKLQMLEKRIVTAQLIEHDKQDKSEVRFGSTVLLQVGQGNNTRKLQIVGVDEADLKQNKIAFTSPLGQLLMNKKIGEKAVLELKDRQSVFTILEIE